MHTTIPPSNRPDIQIPPVRLLSIAARCPGASLYHTHRASLPRALIQPITTSHCFRGCNLRPYDVQALLTSNPTYILSSSLQIHAPDPLEHFLCRAQQSQLHYMT
jgi:hypothetical protein